MQATASKTFNPRETAPASTKIVGRRLWNSQTIWIDFLFAVLAMAIYILWIYRFRYRGLLAEDDLYRLLAGLLDGARSGTYFLSPNQYGKTISFGYLAAFFHFASPQTLADPQRLIALINGIGFWSAATGCFFFWLLARMLYGLRSATVAVSLFALSPMMLELGTSGHPILPAFAFFAAGACCLCIRAHGIRAILLAVVGSLLLLAAMVTRAEILLTFPFVVLARTDSRSVWLFLKCASKRAIAPALVAATFFALKAAYVDATAGTARLGPFLEQFVRWKNIPLGVAVYVLVCGAATALAGLIAIVAILRELRAAPQGSAHQTALIHSAIGPLALALPAFAFWIANPRPGRHFILCLAGISILAGWLITRYVPIRPLPVYALAIGLVFANQICGALTGPIILKYAPSKILALPGNIHHLPRGFATGSSLGYHRAFVAEQMRATAFADRVRATCSDKTLVLSLDATQIFSDLYAGSSSWSADEQKIYRFPILTTQIGGRTIAVLSENGGWPHDAAADALADPTFRDYKLARDPNTISIYDHAAIPPGRTAQLDCEP